jgi:hypothetical protein
VRIHHRTICTYRRYRVALANNLIDHLKHTASTVDRAEEQLGAIRPNWSPEETGAAIEAAICNLATAYTLLKDIVGVVCPHCCHHMRTYSDGRPVSSHLHFGEGTRFVHQWHPDVASPENKPRELATLTTRGGNRKRVVIPAVGHLDAFTISETEET